MIRSTPWRKSSHSGGEGGSTCVEVAALEAAIGVRDSTDPDGPHLHLTRTAFATMLARTRTPAS